MIPIITPETMLEEEKIWSIQDPLMRIEKSAEKLLDALIPLVDPECCLIFCVGKGLNGADTLALCEKAIEAGFDVNIFMLFHENELKKETHHFYQNVLKLEACFIKDFPLKGKFILIDGVFGAGFNGDLSVELSVIFKKINALPFLKIAVDIPSGICGKNGSGSCFIEADITLSIGFPKWGLFVHSGRFASGKIEHLDIGLQGTIASKKALGYFLTKEALYPLYPKEKAYFHKYDRGQVLGIASHPSFKGASYLYSLAAYRSGAGLARIFHEKQNMFFDHLAPEVTQHEFSEATSFLEKNKSAWVIGPGMVSSLPIQEMVHKILEKRKPCVIDGGAFSLVPSSKYHEAMILTPHLDELRKLLKLDTNDFDELVKNASNELLKSGSTLIIKGHHSWILHQDHKPIISSLAPKSVATAGSGDVLSGIIATFLAKGLSSLDAAILGVGLHSLAGIYAEQKGSPRALLSSDIIASLQDALDLL